MKKFVSVVLAVGMILTAVPLVAKAEGTNQKSTEYSRWGKIETQPILSWDFDSETENGLKLSNTAKVEKGKLDLTANGEEGDGNAYAILPDLTENDFSDGMTVTMKVMLDEEPKGNWTNFFLFGNGELESGINPDQFAYKLTTCFNHCIDLDDVSHKSGFFGDGTVVINGVEKSASNALINKSDKNFWVELYSDETKLNCWDIITVSVDKDGTLKTYFNDILVEQYKDEKYTDILEQMKRASSNYLGASYFLSDYYMSGQFEDFAIYNKALSDDDVKKLYLDEIIQGDVSLSYETTLYTGSKQVPDVTVTHNGVILTKDKDYTLTMNGEGIQTGIYSITVSGIGNYSGTVTKEYIIQGVSLAVDLHIR